MNTVGAAGKGLRTKRTPPCNRGIGVEISPHAKVGRLPHGLSSQESWQNHLNGGKANGRSNMGVCTFRRDMERHQLGRGSTSSKRAASAYCEGNTGWQTQHG
jgi:hypothetical protein